MDTSTYIFNQAFEFFNKPKDEKCLSCCNKRFIKYFRIINKIQDIPVECSIYIDKFEKSFDFSFRLESPNISVNNCCEYDNYILFEYDKNYEELTKINIYNFLLEIKEILPNLKFDKLFGEFYNKEKFYENTIGDDFFGKNFIEAKECSVCLDLTKTLTDCDHPLCIECWSKLKNNSCPICRENDIMIKGEQNCDCKFYSGNNIINLSNNNQEEDNEEEDNEEEDNEDNNVEDDEITEYSTIDGSVTNQEEDD